MPRFGSQSVPLRSPDIRSLEGGPAFSRTPKDELFVLGMTNFVGVDTFYESAAERDARFAELVRRCTSEDPVWTAAFIGWLRGSAQIRSASVIAAVEYVRAGGPGGRAVISSACQRPDEPGEILAYWALEHPSRGRGPLRLPAAVKRGVADACQRLYNERAVLRYDGAGRAWRFADVLELCHPRASAPWQGDLYRWCIDRRHNREDRLPESLGRIRIDRDLQRLAPEQRRGALPSAAAAGWPWERLAGWLPGGMDAEAWEAIIPNMGAMALVRNLRNLDGAGISRRARELVRNKLMDPEEIRRSRQLPIRFLTAWLNLSSLGWGEPLEAALQASLANVPALRGRTLLLVDISPSMRDMLLGARRDGRAGAAQSPRRWQAAAVFAAGLAQRADDARMVLFDHRPQADARMRPGDSALRFAEQCGDLANRSNGTDILRALAESFDDHDRVVILTDEQSGYTAGRYRLGHNYGSFTERWGWDDVAHIKAPVYTFNLAGYLPGVTPNEANWLTVGGLSDACFGMLDAFERRRSDAWPWESPAVSAFAG